MGEHSVSAIKSLSERKEFLYHVLNDIKALEMMIDQNLLEQGVQRIGAEQELCLVDKNFRPSNSAIQILEKLGDNHFTTEIALFNLEINLDPLRMEGDCFSKMEKQLQAKLDLVDRIAGELGVHVVMAGILPTLRSRDLVFDNITPLERYKLLNKILCDLRGDDFLLKIRGVDELILKHKSILFEACNTSFQVHLQLSPEELKDKYNWAQAIAGPVLSVCTNSPLLLGKELWNETRIALFQQSVDIRNRSYLSRGQKPRVSFGSDWIKDSILEIYQDDIVRYTPIIRADVKEDAVEKLAKGEVPKLKAIQIHNGTIYRWNRLCYGQSNGKPHLRIENRYMPAGPTVKDEIANAVFWTGLMKGMPDEFKDMTDHASFNEVKRNFISAARTGINTYFHWFGKGISAKKLILTKLLDLAKEGLVKSNVGSEDIDYYLSIIEQRTEQSKTGSQWMKKSFYLLKKDMTVDIANANITAHMYKNQKKGLPVHRWQAAEENILSEMDIMTTKLEKFMTTEIFVVNEDDLVELVSKVMEWKKVHHIPVVNHKNKLTGIITSTNLRSIEGADQNLIVAKDIMVKEVITAESNTTIEKANKLMIDKGIGCLLIVELGELVGILTKNDLTKLLESNK